MKSIETKEEEITSGEQLNMSVNEGNHLNNNPIKVIILTREINNWIKITIQVVHRKNKVAPTTEKRQSLLMTLL